MSRKRKDRPIFLDKGWQPCQILFCPSKEAWDYALKRMKSTDPYPITTSWACVQRLEHVDGGLTIAVCVNDCVDSLDFGTQMSVLVHEAVHVWQFICKHTGIRKPDWETEAYSIQHITTELIQAYMDTRGPDVEITRTTVD